MNDLSARVLQMDEMKLSLGPAKGKDFATAIGPYLRHARRARRCHRERRERQPLRPRHARLRQRRAGLERQRLADELDLRPNPRARELRRTICSPATSSAPAPSAPVVSSSSTARASPRTSGCSSVTSSASRSTASAPWKTKSFPSRRNRADRSENAKSCCPMRSRRPHMLSSLVNGNCEAAPSRVRARYPSSHRAASFACISER